MPDNEYSTLLFDGRNNVGYITISLSLLKILSQGNPWSDTRQKDHVHQIQSGGVIPSQFGRQIPRRLRTLIEVYSGSS